MKKLVLLTSIAFLLISTEIFSACPTPKDCIGNPYDGPYYRNIVLTPTCTLRYEYCY